MFGCVCVSLCLSNLLQTHSHIHNEFNCFLDEHRNYIISPISSYGREIKQFFLFMFILQIILLLKSLKLFNTCTRFEILLQILSHVLAYATACINPVYVSTLKTCGNSISFYFILFLSFFLFLLLLRIKSFSLFIFHMHL